MLLILYGSLPQGPVVTLCTWNSSMGGILRVAHPVRVLTPGTSGYIMYLELFDGWDPSCCSSCTGPYPRDQWLHYVPGTLRWVGSFVLLILYGSLPQGPVVTLCTWNSSMGGILRVAHPVRVLTPGTSGYIMYLELFDGWDPSCCSSCMGPYPRDQWLHYVPGTLRWVGPFVLLILYGSLPQGPVVTLCTWNSSMGGILRVAHPVRVLTPGTSGYIMYLELFDGWGPSCCSSCTGPYPRDQWLHYVPGTLRWVGSFVLLILYGSLPQGPVVTLCTWNSSMGGILRVAHPVRVLTPGTSGYIMYLELFDGWDPSCCSSCTGPYPRDQWLHYVPGTLRWVGSFVLLILYGSLPQGPVVTLCTWNSSMGGILRVAHPVRLLTPGTSGYIMYLELPQLVRHAGTKGRFRSPVHGYLAFLPICRPTSQLV